MTDVLGWIGEHHEPLTPLMRAQREEALADAAEEREAERRRFEAAERREALLVANAVAGNPMGELAAAQQRMAADQDQVNELRARLEKAEARLESSRSSVQWWADQSLVAQELTSRSSMPAHDPLYEASRYAREQWQRMTDNAAARSQEVAGHKQRLLARLGQR